MRLTLVYDLPTRIFHGLFSVVFLISFVIAKTIDDESLLFSYHMLSGLLLGGLVVWRIVWGFIGTEHARFSGFNLNPLQLKDYLWGILMGEKKLWLGHNPASSWAAIAMFVLALGLAITGYLMGTGQKETFEDIHEFMANAFIVIVMFHIAGVVLHSIRHQDSIALSMINGKKESLGSTNEIPSTRRYAAAVLIVLVISGSFYLFRSFDSHNRSVNIFGKSLQFHENDYENQAETHD